MAAAASSSKSNAENNPMKRARAAACSYLPDELWECIIKFLASDNPSLKSLSIVSKTFLSITNHFRFSLTITDQTVLFIPRLFRRFPNITSLDLTHFSRVSDLDALITQISTFALDLKLIYLSKNRNIENKLPTFSEKMKNLTSVTSYRVRYIHNDLSFVADYFPLLEELDLSLPMSTTKSCFVLHEDDIDNDQSLAFHKHRKINLSCDYTNHKSINYLLKNCDLEEVIMTELISCERWTLRDEDDDE